MQSIRRAIAGTVTVQHYLIYVANNHRSPPHRVDETFLHPLSCSYLYLIQGQGNDDNGIEELKETSDS